MDLDIRQIDASASADWNSYVNHRSDAAHYHQYGWRDFFGKFFRKQTIYFAAYENRHITGVLPLVRQKSWLFGDYLVSLPFVNYAGVLANTDEVANKIIRSAVEVAETLGVSFIELREYGQRTNMPCRLEKVSMQLSLPPTSEELGRLLGSKRRSQIKRPLRENPTVLIGGTELVDQFYCVFSRNMRDIGTPVYAKSMFTEIMRLFPDDTEIVVIEIDRRPAAAAFLLHYRDTTEVPWASTVSQYNNISLNMMLYWELLKTAINQGSTVFDFGRSTIDTGTYRFKRQWGASPVQLSWNYWLDESEILPELNPSNSKYELAIKLWKKLPLPVSNAIGPYLVKNLP